jgi:predicted dehydrogenase
MSAIGGQAVFAPDPQAPERCSSCRRECPYRVADPRGARTDRRQRADSPHEIEESRLAETDPIKRHDTCVWYPGADINDHGLVSIEYGNGVKASLFWTLFGPDADDQETLEVVGNRGRIVLTRHLGTIDLVTDYGSRHELLDERSPDSAAALFGANDQYIRELDQFCKGAQPAVTTREGLLVARMVEAAHRSVSARGAWMEMNEIPGGE